jgi:hypothetical protein
VTQKAIEPRLAPPVSDRNQLADYRKIAKAIGWRPMTWQQRAVASITAEGRAGRLQYPEAAVIVARQNGKTALLKTLIVLKLLRGRKIMHTAQNRELPREVFTEVADAMVEHWRADLRKLPRLANGQERIELWNGGLYRIVAPTRGGARGPANDDVIIDELREFDSFDFMAAARPTLTASTDPQMLYLSNAGDETSVVLNALRKRADADPALAFLEWSAAPERAVSDQAGWREANPRIERYPRAMLDYLQRQFTTYELEGQLAIFETEHLCRWVTSLLPRLVADVPWQRAAATLEAPSAPFMGVALDGDRASAALAWQQSDGTIALTLAADVTGHPLDIDELGKRLLQMQADLAVQAVGFGPATDRDLARHLRGGHAIAGQEWASASDRFARMVDGGRLRHQDAGAIAADLPFTARRTAGGMWSADKAKSDRPVTAVLAAIRAVWLATNPAGVSRLY